MIEFKYRHLWKPYVGYSKLVRGNKYECHFNNLHIITQYLTNCTLSEDDWIIKNIIE